MAPDEPDGSTVVITNRDIYREVIQLKETVSAMSSQATTLADHEQRIRATEKWKYAVGPSLLASSAALIDAMVRGK